MDKAVYRCPGLTEEDIAFLQKVEEGMAIMADISRADVLMYCALDLDRAVVVAQARPHSVSPVYTESALGQVVTAEEEPFVLRTLERKRPSSGHLQWIANGAPLVQEVYPICNPSGKLVGALGIKTNLLERERHRRRSRVFQRAVRWLQEMVVRGALEGAGALSPFGEYDGIMVVDAEGWIRYMSGVATNLYRRLGYMGKLVGKHLSSLDTGDEALASQAMEEGRCLEEETEEKDRIWVRKAIPLFVWESRPSFLRPFFPTRSPRLAGVMLTIHDSTEVRRKEQELRVKSAMIREIHHRVKNNLQAIASLLRMQARRARSEETRRTLQDSINRILSVAVIHEFLSEHEARVINIREVSQRIIQQTRQGILDTEKKIRLELVGPDVYLPAQQATACALVINELLQNAVEHGYERRKEGTITLYLREEANQVTVEVHDDGAGLPAGFALEEASGLGLQIVRTLVQDDLRGRFQLISTDGVSAIVTFTKLPPEKVSEESLR